MTTAKTLIRFVDVGRDKKTWEAEIPHMADHLCGDSMIRSIRRSGALMSRSIDVEEDGRITVGGFRTVGRWEIATQEHP